MDAPQQEAVVVVVTQADGSKIFDEEISESTAHSLKRALEELSDFETSSEDDHKQISSANQNEQALNNFQAALQDFKQVAAQAENILPTIEKNIDTIINQKSRLDQLERAFNKQQKKVVAQQQDTSCALLLLSQQKNQQLQSQINDMKHEQAAIKQEFGVQYKKIYSEKLATVCTMNKQHNDIKIALTQEIADLRFYVKFLGYSFAATICGFLVWFYIQQK